MIMNIFQNAHRGIKQIRNGTRSAARMPFCTFPIDTSTIDIIFYITMSEIIEKFVASCRVQVLYVTPILRRTQQLMALFFFNFICLQWCWFHFRFTSVRFNFKNQIKCALKYPSFKAVLGGKCMGWLCSVVRRIMRSTPCSSVRETTRALQPVRSLRAHIQYVLNFDLRFFTKLNPWCVNSVQPRCPFVKQATSKFCKHNDT